MESPDFLAADGVADGVAVLLLPEESPEEEVDEPLDPPSDEGDGAAGVVESVLPGEAGVEEEPVERLSLR